MRPLLSSDAFVRTYLGRSGRFWVLVRRPGRERLRLDAVTRAILELCDGKRRSDQIAREAETRLPRLLDAGDVERLLRPIVAAGAMIDLDAPPDREAVEPSAIGLKLALLDDETAAGLRVVPAPSTGLGCHGRGGCCSLYDRLRLAPADAGRIAQAYGDEITPGGLSVESALFRERGDEEVFGLAVQSGTCVLVEADGACGVHRRLGAAGKPAGCHAYPLRDVKCGGELHVGLAVECRCAVDFSGADPATLARAAVDVLEARRRIRTLEEVAAEVPLAPGRVVPRAEYVDWRAATTRRALAGADDVLRWARDEARALGAASPAQFLEPLASWLAFEAADTAQHYDENDLQRRLFAWAGAAARNLGGEHAPVEGERFVAQQLLHTHGLLRSPSAAMGLTALALRLQLARAGGAVPTPPELLPVSSVEYLGRVYALGRIFD